MINLLPTDYRLSIVYGRKNWMLRKWILIMVVALLVSLAITAGGYLFMDHSIKAQTEGLETAKAELQSENIDGTKKELGEISANTKLILQVLSKEILFSKLIRQLGASLPANTAIEDIRIDKLDGGVSLQALATSVEAATQLQVNLNDPSNKIFEKADIEDISCKPIDKDSPYACTVKLKALFAKNNPYTYIPTTTTTEKSP